MTNSLRKMVLDSRFGEPGNFKTQNREMIFMKEKNYKARNFWIHAISPIHVGTGRGVGFIDLPISREKVTNWPYIPGSGIKGVIADYYDASDSGNRRENDKKKKAAFGLAGDDNSSAGSLVFTDARIACLPIQSLYGTFAWCTSELVLRSLLRDLEWGKLCLEEEIPAVSGEKVLVTEGSSLIEESNKKIYLQELDLESQVCEKTKKLAEKIANLVFPDDEEWRKTFIKRFAILPENVFNYLCEMGTQVDARTKIDSEKGVVIKGGLWYEEALPAETILTGMVWCDKVYVKDIQAEELVEAYCKGSKSIQIGGKNTTGRGRITLSFTDTQKEG
jgi:CRISPR-associated protein Cmr4